MYSSNSEKSQDDSQDKTEVVKGAMILESKSEMLGCSVKTGEQK